MSKATPITEGTSKGDWYCKISELSQDQRDELATVTSNLQDVLAEGMR